MNTTQPTLLNRVSFAFMLLLIAAFCFSAVMSDVTLTMPPSGVRRSEIWTHFPLERCRTRGSVPERKRAIRSRTWVS